MKQKKHLAIVGSMLLALTACSGGSSELDPTQKPAPAAKVPINISTSIQSRATDLAFEAGDQIGLFVVNPTIKPTALPQHSKRQVTI